MKLKPVKIGQLILAPKTILTLLSALLVLGIGIGVTVASGKSADFFLFGCTIISILLIAYSFLKLNKTNLNK